MRIMRRLRNRYETMKLDRFMKQVKSDNKKFDAAHGVATAANIELSDYDVAKEMLAEMQPAQSIHEGVFRKLVKELIPHPEAWDFLDVGCGQGKALLVASTYPFRRIRGVELERRVCELAQRNVTMFMQSVSTQCHDIETVCADARSYADYRDRTFVLFANPFNGEIMWDFVAQLGRVAQDGRELVVAYLVPRDTEPFDQASFLTCHLKARRLQVFATPSVQLEPGSAARLAQAFNVYQL
jgi:SAM-dependent methyltransferase